MNHNLDVAHGLRRRDLEDAGGKERKGRRERGGERWNETEAVEGTNMANWLKAMHRRYVHQSASWHDGGAFVVSISTRSITLLSFSFLFPPFFFFQFLLLLFLISRKLAERTNLTPAPALGEGRSNADLLRFFAQNHCRYHHHCRADPFVFFR